MFSPSVPRGTNLSNSGSSFAFAPDAMWDFQNQPAGSVPRGTQDDAKEAATEFCPELKPC